MAGLMTCGLAAVPPKMIYLEAEKVEKDSKLLYYVILNGMKQMSPSLPHGTTTKRVHIKQYGKEGDTTLPEQEKARAALDQRIEQEKNKFSKKYHTFKVEYKYDAYEQEQKTSQTPEKKTNPEDQNQSK